ncbi:hypothetical protein, partial [Azospirillum sp.]|uniref:hypothetical protein n=1 Tax=Azospirillum sp. TaxID=34012 RepID=UPI0026281695
MATAKRRARFIIMAPLPRLFVAAMMRRSGTKRKSARERSTTDETGRATDETGAVGGVATADPCEKRRFPQGSQGVARLLARLAPGRCGGRMERLKRCETVFPTLFTCSIQAIAFGVEPPSPSGLPDSHNVRICDEFQAAFCGLELHPSLPHDDWAWLAVVA